MAGDFILTYFNIYAIRNNESGGRPWKYKEFIVMNGQSGGGKGDTKAIHVKPARLHCQPIAVHRTSFPRPKVVVEVRVLQGAIRFPHLMRGGQNNGAVLV